MDYSKEGGQGTASCRSLTGLLQSHQFLCSHVNTTPKASYTTYKPYTCQHHRLYIHTLTLPSAHLRTDGSEYNVPSCQRVVFVLTPELCYLLPHLLCNDATAAAFLAVNLMMMMIMMMIMIVMMKTMTMKIMIINDNDGGNYSLNVLILHTHTHTHTYHNIISL